jgi:hypothetical protein
MKLRSVDWKLTRSGAYKWRFAPMIRPIVVKETREGRWVVEFRNYVFSRSFGTKEAAMLAGEKFIADEYPRGISFSIAPNRANTSRA